MKQIILFSTIVILLIIISILYHNNNIQIIVNRVSRCLKITKMKQKSNNIYTVTMINNKKDPLYDITYDLNKKQYITKSRMPIGDIVNKIPIQIPVYDFINKQTAKDFKSLPDFNADKDYTQNALMPISYIGYGPLIDFITSDGILTYMFDESNGLDSGRCPAMLINTVISNTNEYEKLREISKTSYYHASSGSEPGPSPGPSPEPDNHCHSDTLYILNYISGNRPTITCTATTETIEVTGPTEFEISLVGIDIEKDMITGSIVAYSGGGGGGGATLCGGGGGGGGAAAKLNNIKFYRVYSRPYKFSISTGGEGGTESSSAKDGQTITIEYSDDVINKSGTIYGGGAGGSGNSIKAGNSGCSGHLEGSFDFYHGESIPGRYAPAGALGCYYENKPGIPFKHRYGTGGGQGGSSIYFYGDTYCGLDDGNPEHDNTSIQSTGFGGNGMYTHYEYGGAGGGGVGGGKYWYSDITPGLGGNINMTCKIEVIGDPNAPCIPGTSWGTKGGGNGGDIDQNGEDGFTYGCGGGGAGGGTESKFKRGGRGYPGYIKIIINK